jgi:hypothetical protein
MNCIVNGVELHHALKEFNTKTVSITPDGLECVKDGRLLKVQLPSLIPVGECTPITLPVSAIPQTNDLLDVITEGGVILLAGTPAFDEGYTPFKHPKFENEPVHVSYPLYERLLPFVTYEGSIHTERLPLWYMKITENTIQASNSRMVITHPMKSAVRTYLYPMPNAGGPITVVTEGHWIKQQAGPYTLIHRYDGPPWPTLPKVDVPPDRIVDKLPDEIHIHDHELRLIERTLGTGYVVELRRGRPIMFRNGAVSIMVQPLNGE